MMAVFVKNEFKGLWHNTKNDQGWVEATCKGMAWNPLDVVILDFDYPFNPQTVYLFDVEKNLLIQEKQIKYREINGVNTEMEVWVTTETWKGTIYYLNGNYAA